MGLREQSIVSCFPEFVFLFSVVQVRVGLRKQFMNDYVFPTWACAAGFDNFNNTVLTLRITYTVLTLFAVCRVLTLLTAHTVLTLLTAYSLLTGINAT